jgi:threonine-phosphate decarboxylase
LPELITHLRDNIQVITALPEPDASTAINCFAKRYNLDPRFVLAGNGTTQFIYSLPQALNMRKALILGPTYSDYADACAMHGVDYEFLLSTEECDFKQDLDQVQRKCQEVDTVFICNPNNPTGTFIDSRQLLDLIRKNSKTRFVIDESYLPFVSGQEDCSLMGCKLTNLLVLHSMSKLFRIPGLRIGFLVSSPELIRKVGAYLQPWSVNSLSQATIKYLMSNPELVAPFEQKTREFMQEEREAFSARLEGSKHIRLFPSTTTFFLLNLQEGYTAEQVCNFLLEDKILIRNCANFKGLSASFIRVSLKDSKNNKLVAEKIASWPGSKEF